mgnify:CR=1 FL=1|jgi:hypothetical protein|tara:strand:+ start:321 stop:680 length:360 start_codon:yes stop_codon:yes gene_type:complete
MAKKLSCIVSGRTLTIANSYYQKKLDKAGDEEKLHSTYICKEAKKLLRIGNTVNSVREKLCDEETINDLPEIDENLVTQIIFGNNKKKFQSTTDFNTLSSVTHNQTDPEVLSFIEKLSK